MKNIVTLNEKPIYASTDLIDWWLVVKSLFKNLIENNVIIEPLKDKDFDEYRGFGTIRGERIETLLYAYNVKVWIYNELARDWYLK